ncbi:DUF4157 domain-containing protein [Nostoc sp. FACHB-973]|nr:DUF4157 domain-containing protein [Nostoc sp. FACHB-973]
MNKAIVQNHTSVKPSLTPLNSGILQRKCVCGKSSGLSGQCSECQSKKLTLQRQQKNQEDVSEVPPIVHEVLRSPGQPLDSHTRAFMESRFGHNFSQVRVHTDVKAAESAQAVNALAYTVGQDVVFGAGQYAPGITAGKKLLAHELVHTLQQSKLELNKNLKLGKPSDFSEREADIAAQNSLNNLAIKDLNYEQETFVRRQVPDTITEESTTPQVQQALNPGSWLQLLPEQPTSNPDSRITKIIDDIKKNREGIRTRYLNIVGKQGYEYTADKEAFMMPKSQVDKNAKAFREQNSDSAELAKAASDYFNWQKTAELSDTLKQTIDPKKAAILASIWKSVRGEGDASAINTYDRPDIENFSWGRGFATAGGQLQEIMIYLFARNPTVKNIFLNAGIAIDEKTKEFIVVDVNNNCKTKGKAARNILRFDKKLISLFINVAQGNFLSLSDQESQKIRQDVLDAQMMQLVKNTANLPAFALKWSEDAQALVAHNVHLGGTIFKGYKNGWYAFSGISGDLKSAIRRIAELCVPPHKNGALVVSAGITKRRLIDRAGGIAMKELDGPFEYQKMEQLSIIYPLYCTDNPELLPGIGEGNLPPCRFQTGKVYFQHPTLRNMYYVLKE